MSDEDLRGAASDLSAATIDMHRAIVSRAILAHNRDEKKEHAAMVLEWIRRNDPAFDKELKDYLFTTKPIAHE